MPDVNKTVLENNRGEIMDVIFPHETRKILPNYIFHSTQR